MVNLISESASPGSALIFSSNRLFSSKKKIAALFSLDYLYHGCRPVTVVYLSQKKIFNNMMDIA